MFVADAVELAESPLEIWLRIGSDDGAWLRTLGTRMAEGGPLRNLLRFAQPYDDRGQPIRFDIEVRPQAGQGGAIFVHWDAHYARLEGELEVAPAGPEGSRLHLRASYEPSWAAALGDRHTLQKLADEAVGAFLRQVATSLPQPAVAARPRRRVLIEDEDPAWYDLMVRMADADEYEFASCQGPFLAEGGCPLLQGLPCPKAEWADTILHSLDQRQPANAAVLAALQRRFPDAVLTTLDGEPATYCFTRRSKTRTEGMTR